MSSVFGVLGKLCGSTGGREDFERMLTAEEPEESIMAAMALVGRRFQCDRVYVVEVTSDDRLCNTYEWCAEGVAPQKELLQNESKSMVDVWFRLFEEGRPVIIEALEDIREIHPRIYSCLKTQEVRSLLAVPVRIEGEIVGFWGADNPADCRSEELQSFLLMLGNLVAMQLERGRLLEEIDYIRTHDPVSGCLNRRALEGALGKKVKNSMGVVCFGVSDLKAAKDDSCLGTRDELLFHWCEILRGVFTGYDIYMADEDELVVLCPEIAREEMLDRISAMELRMRKEAGHLDVGSYWSDKGSSDPIEYISQARRSMKRRREDYYSQVRLLPGRGRERRRRPDPEKWRVDPESEFGRYVQENYFDPESFFSSVSQTGFYPFMGDLRTNVFFISEEMKNRFGFQSCLVTDLIGEWEGRICSGEDLELFREDMGAMLWGKKDYHELCYRVRDAEQNEVWIFCRGGVLRNEAGEPVFFSGGFSLQDRSFVVDPVSNFPREMAAILKIEERWSRGMPVTIIGFAMNHFSEINEIRGRYRTDLLLRDICNTLKNRFEGKLRFYRLDGLRFAAMLRSDCMEGAEQLARQIREIVTGLYCSGGIVVRVPCSVGIICIREPVSHFGDRPVHPRELLGDVIALLDTARSCPEKEYIIHSPDTLSLHRAHSQMLMKLGGDIRRDCENFRIVIQPAVQAADGRVTSGEALLRWRLQGEDVPAEVFIGILEKNRMIIPVGRWVCEQVVRILRRIITYRPDFRLAFNVSYHQIMDEEFIPFLKSRLQKYGVRGESLILEITETHYDESPAKLLGFIESCRELGVGIAMDDFGNGYASLAFLLKYPADIVKLDKCLLDGITHSQDHVNFLSSIVYACHKFGRLVCAEGVEREAELELVRGTGCDMIQGFYFYRPMELDDFFGMLASPEGYLPSDQCVL